jgi:hypothetical protein
MAANAHLRTSALPLDATSSTDDIPFKCRNSCSMREGKTFVRLMRSRKAFYLFAGGIGTAIVIDGTIASALLRAFAGLVLVVWASILLDHDFR